MWSLRSEKFGWVETTRMDDSLRNVYVGDCRNHLGEHFVKTMKDIKINWILMRTRVMCSGETSHMSAVE
uniref:Uncharacterized protein n=1 Tax=Pristionchus pacificus TaxID=54126 RepID=A0A2A6CUD9_PRIPA|eukprot:PDM81854.1 hypothetical protein PRIPAC_34008 [Pristionchus pacificus]